MAGGYMRNQTWTRRLCGGRLVTLTHLMFIMSRMPIVSLRGNTFKEYSVHQIKVIFHIAVKLCLLIKNLV